MSNHTAKTKILYMEDNPILQTIISLTLEKQGLQVRTASNGAEGVQMALEWLPDLILMDLMMPIMDGFQATEVLRADPRTRQIPIVAFSCATEANMQARAQEVGMNGFILKSHSSADMISALRAYFPSSIE